MIIVAHRPMRVMKYEYFRNPAAALARYADLLWSGASQLVMYDAVPIAEVE